MKIKQTLVALSAGAAATLALATQGVSDTTITLGSLQDLSGPIAGFGKQLRFGMEMRVNEINEQGGIHGRKLDLKFEDMQYDPKKAVIAAQKLVNQDKVFAMLGNLGTAVNMAVMPLEFSKDVINFFPVTAARQMYEPFHKLKFAYATPYYDQMRIFAGKMAKEKGAQKVCTMYQDDDFGLEVVRGAEAGLKDYGMEMAVKTSFKRGATDFSSQMQKMAAEKCDMVVMGTIIRETIGGIATARRLGFNPIFLGSSASYTDLIHKLGKGAMDGFYSTMSTKHPYLDDASPNVARWALKYKTAFNEDPTVFSAYGYNIVDIFAQAADRAGKNLTTDTMVKALESTVVEPDMFGSAKMTFGPKKRLGTSETRLSQLQNQRWVVVGDYTSLKK